MKNIGFILFLAIMIANTSTVNAQDAHFLQYNTAPMLLNPALTGGGYDAKGDLPSNRVMLNYANEWATALQSKSFNKLNLSYDMMIPVGRYDGFGAGISVGGNRSGALDITNGDVKIAAAFQRRIGGYRQKSHYLQIGLEGGMLALPSSNIASKTSFLPNAGAGIVWQTNLDYNNYFNIGVSATHLNRGQPSFVNEGFEGIYTKYTIHGSGSFKVNKKISLLPAIAYYTQGPYYELTPGTALQYDFSTNKRTSKALQLGAWARFNNTFKMK